MNAVSRVLFLHPVALDDRASDWLDLPGVFSPTFPGHGTRARRPGMTLDDLVDEIDGWVHEPVHVVGCSLGGMVAMRLAMRRPELVKSLVLAFTTARTPRELMLDRAYETENGDQMELIERTMQRWFTESALSTRPAPAGVAYARHRLLATDRFTVADTWRAIAEHDVLAELSKISVPTTCVAGERDRSTPREAVEAMAVAIPDARFVLMDAPHMGFLENPDVFRAIVVDHLEQASDHP